jgi:hypothetical protein
MALGSTQPPIEMSTRNVPGGKGRPACKADNLTAICEPIVYKNVGASTSHNSMWSSRACYRDRFTLFFVFFFTYTSGPCKTLSYEANILFYGLVLCVYLSPQNMYPFSLTEIELIIQDILRITFDSGKE